MKLPLHCHCIGLMLSLLFVSQGQTEPDRFPYTLDMRVYGLPEAFTTQFSGITNEMVRNNVLHEFYELQFANTGIVERTESGNDISLRIPLVARFSPSRPSPTHFVNIRFMEPSGEFLPVLASSASNATLLVSMCRSELQRFYMYNTNAAQRYWMSPVQAFGGLAKISFFDLPNGADESLPNGTNGWGIAFWVDFDDPTLLNWEPILPPEDLYP